MEKTEQEEITEENSYVVKVEKGENSTGTVSSMISKIGNAWTCNSCGKVSNNKSNMRKHVENMHIEGLEYSCKICDKMFRSVNSVYSHTARVPPGTSGIYWVDRD